MTIGRNSRGSVIVFSTVLALALVLLGVGFVFLLMYMGGQHETKNAVDAGALNVGKQALDNIKVTLDGSASQQLFYGVTSDTDDGSSANDGKVTLRRINRVWAEALLIGINADAAKAAGLDQSGEGNAALAFAGAQSISNNLSQQLTTASNLYGFFSDFSKANTVRMIGAGSSTDVLPSSNWQTSLMDRVPITGAPRESNITINSNLPPNYSLPQGYTTPSTRNPPIASANGLTFLAGYKPLNVAGNNFWQVPFQYDEKPRLVSQSVFNQSQNSAAPLNWPQAVPNAFSVEGQVQKSGGIGEKAMSWVLTNPRQSFQMAIPRSFLHIHLDQMTSQWYFFPNGYPPVHMPAYDQNYDYMLTTQSASMPGGGLLCTTVSGDSVDVGTDVVGRSLDDIIFGAPCTNTSGTSAVEAQMTNRINEMITKVGKSYSASDLHGLLSAAWTIADLAAGSGARDFYIYSNDGVNLSLVSDKTKFTAPSWLQQEISTSADDQETKLVSDDNQWGPGEFLPMVVPDPSCTTVLDFGWSTWDKDLNWQPGSGYNSCLGQVRVTRWTDIYALGAAAETVL